MDETIHPACHVSPWHYHVNQMVKILVESSPCQFQVVTECMSIQENEHLYKVHYLLYTVCLRFVPVYMLAYSMFFL